MSGKCIILHTNVFINAVNTVNILLITFVILFSNACGDKLPAKLLFVIKLDDAICDNFMVAIWDNVLMFNSFNINEIVSARALCFVYNISQIH